MKKLLQCMLCAFVMFTTVFSGNVVSVTAEDTVQLVNVATKGTAEASQVSTGSPTRVGSQINDGVISLNSYWDSGEMVDGKECYVILDLQKEYDVKEFKLYNYWGTAYAPAEGRIYKYEIYTSLDKENWDLVAIKDNDNPASSSGDYYQLDEAKTARYVKVKCTGSNINGNITHLVELQVFALPEENIALNKPVTAAQGVASRITDGDITNYWDGGVGPQSFIIDLEDYYKLSSLHAYPYYAFTRYYHYEIYGSDNGVNWTLIGEKKTNETETKNGTEFTIPEELKDSVFRYIKVTMLYNSSNTSVHMNEFEAYGTKVEGYVPSTPTDPTDSNNIAFLKDTHANTGTNISSWAVDGDVETTWSTYTFPSNLDVDLGENYSLDDITLYFPVVEGRYYKYTVYTSLDGVDFTRLVQKRDDVVVDADGDTYELNDVEARYIRINVEFVSDGVSALLSEIRAHGTATDTVTKDREELVIPEFVGSGYDAPITEEETIAEINALVERRLGSEYKDWFVFELAESTNGEDFYEISNKDGKILIKGNEGVSITTGLNYYLKYFCKVQITQQTEQLNSMPESVVPVSETIYKSTPLTVRYAYNYCTLSYTNAFYGEEDWQRELDWLALNGVNVILDTTGQEAVWIDFLQKIGYSTDDAEAWLVGPGYVAWQLMSNMENFGGPINDQYVLDRLEMARKNQRWMRVLGITPVLQGYTGMIPSDYENVVEDKDTYQYIIDAMMPQGTWGGQFNRPDMLKTNSQAFQDCAELFYASQEKVLGNISNYYAADPFHEGGIPPKDLSTAEISELVLAKMMEFDSDAIWMIQSWESNPTKGLLDGLGEYREDHALILDLSSTTDPHWNNSKWGEEFYGTSWVYCMLDNFGDRPGVHGELEVIATQVAYARANSNHMKGIGITPEGTKLNPVNYELFFETAWEEDEIDLEEWLKDYVERRYGTYSESAYEGWLKLLDSAYGSEGAHWGGVNSIANYRPGLNPILGNKDTIPYNTKAFNVGVELILEDYDILCESESYLYDVASFLQQQLQNAQLVYYNNFEQAYKDGNLEEFDKYSQLFLDSISVLDEVVATQEDGLLGTWIGRAHDRSANYDDFSKDIFDFNAKSLITTWGGRTSARTLGDYAYRQYSGLMNDYVKPRWEKYIESKREVLANGTEYVAITYDEYFNDMWDFILSDKEYTRETTDAKTELKRLAELVAETYIPADKEVTDDNIAINGYPTSENGNAGGHPIGNAIDDDDNTLWVASSSKVPATYELDLTVSYPVYKIQTVFEQGPAVNRGLFMDFRVEVFNGTEWEVVLESSTSAEQQIFNVYFDGPKDMSKVRVVITAVDSPLYPAIAELRVYSSKGIQILDPTTIERVDNTLLIAEEDTVANIKAKLTADVGELVFYSNGTEMTDDEVVTDDCDVKLVIEGIVVDAVKTRIKADKEELTELVVDLEQLNEDDYTISSWAEYSAVFDEAKKVLEDKTASQEEVNNILNQLQEAKEQLVLRATKEQLTIANNLLAADEELVEANYTEESWTEYLEAKEVLQEAIENAKDVSKDDFAKYLEAYEKARNNLQYKLADYTAVDEAISQIPEDLSGYTEETIKAVKEAVEAVVRGLDITQQETVDGYASAILEAISKLEKVTVGDSSDTSDNYSVEMFIMLAITCLLAIVYLVKSRKTVK